MKDPLPSRRAFIKAGLGTLFTSALSFSALRAAAREAARTDKPVLTARTLNRRVAQLARQPRRFAQNIESAQSNLGGFLNAHFTLTPQQQEKVATMPAAARQRLFRALDEALVFSRENLQALGEGVASVPPEDTSALLFFLPPIPDDAFMDVETETTTTTTTTTTRNPDGTTTKTTVKIKVKQVTRKKG
ncbi:MAG: hypothetical protein D6722_09595 [Bacteroidetes bacterium]|nr:MAG: hypothetical protein D6722_09595 [Bacteroidota bacterium]